MPVGRRDASATRCARAPRSSTRSRSVAQGAGPHHRPSATRAASPRPKSNEEALEVILQAIDKAGYTAGEQIFARARLAATEFFDKARELRPRGRGQELIDASEMVELLGGLGRRAIPIVSIEDGLAEDDWDGWKLPHRAARRHGPARRRRPVRHQRRAAGRGIERGVANAILVKVNQIGTLTETLDAVRPRAAAPATRRSVATAPARPRTPPSPTSPSPPTPARSRPARRRARDRVAKYNQLLRIEEQLGPASSYPGRSAFRA